MYGFGFSAMGIFRVRALGFRVYETNNTGLGLETWSL